MNGVKKFALNLIVCNLLALAVRIVAQVLFGVIMEGAFMWAVRIVGALGFIFLIYHEGWTHGAADFNLILFEHGEKRTLKGACAAAFASIPSVVLAIGTVMVESGMLKTVAFFEQDLVAILFRLWNLPFDILFGIHPALYLVPMIAMIVLAQIGYTLGLKQIRLSDYLYYAKE